MRESLIQPAIPPLGNRYRIAYCLPVFRPSDTTDTSILLQNLIMEKLKARGYALTLVAPKDMEDVICTVDLTDPKLVERTWSKTGWFNLASRATWHLQRWLGIPYLNVFSNLRLYDAGLQCLPGHDIIQERIGLYKMGIAMACKHLNLPYILFFDSDEILEHDLFGTPIKGLLLRRASQAIRYNLANAARILCVSTLAKTHLVNSWQIPNEKIEVFPNAVDVQRFCPDPGSRAEIKARLGIGEAPMLLFVGSFFPYQDIRTLLEGFARVVMDYPQARLVLVGEGEQYKEMVQYAGGLGLNGSVIFTGFLRHTDIPSMMSAADIAIASYIRIKAEKFLGSSMKLVEYMSSGTAVIASNNGQISEVIQDGFNGILVPASDVNALENAMKRLIGDSQFRQTLGQQARKDAMQRFSWDTYISRLESIYASVIEEHSHKAPY